MRKGNRKMNIRFPQMFPKRKYKNHRQSYVLLREKNKEPMRLTSKDSHD